MKLEADHLGYEHRNRLAEHRRLSLDPTDAPAHDAEPIDHRGVGIGAHQRVRVRHRFAVDRFLTDDPSQMLDVDLVHDPRSGRDDLEVAKRLLSPLEECVAFLVPGELEPHVQLKRIGRSEVIDLHRMVDDELGRLERVDRVRVAAKTDNPVTHGCQVDDRRYAGKIL